MAEHRWHSKVHWRRESQQSRSERTQGAIMDAAEALILQKGTEATAMADIARAASVSVGALYHHFKDKTALYLAIFERMTTAYAALNREASDPALWEGASVRDLLEGYLTLTLSISKETTAAKAAVSAIMADHPDLARHYAEIQAETRRALLRLILARRSEIAHDDPEAAAAFVIDQLAAMLRARIDPTQAAARLTAEASEAEFVARSVEMAARYLGLR